MAMKVELKKLTAHDVTYEQAVKIKEMLGLCKR
jgi:hypothetical protein